MTKVLIYSPDVAGHPQVYCRAMADALQSSPCRLVLALGCTAAASIENSPDIRPLAGRHNVQLIDTRTLTNGVARRLQAEELVKLQVDERVDVTLFIEAEKSADQFLRIAEGAAPALLGRRIGVFANMAEWFPGEDSFTGERRGLITWSLRTTAGNVYRRLLSPKGTPQWWYEQTIIGKGVLDEVWTKDERIAAWRGPPVFWMPEISRPAVQACVEDDPAYFDARKTQVDAFLAANIGRLPLLYFGDAAFYKGYDLFLRLLADNSDLCGFHAGQPSADSELRRYSFDVVPLRAELLKEGRLAETNEYVHSQTLKRLYFQLGPVYATTHRLALSSSTMLQAAEFGVPVLMPDRGLVGYRIKQAGIGQTYPYGDLRSLALRLREMVRGGTAQYQPELRSFASRFSDDALKRFLALRLLGNLQ